MYMKIHDPKTVHRNVLNKNHRKNDHKLSNTVSSAVKQPSLNETILKAKGKRCITMLNPFLPPQTFKRHHKNMRRHNFINQLSKRPGPISSKAIKKTKPNVGEKKSSCQKRILWTPGGKKRKTSNLLGVWDFTFSVS